MEDDLSAFHGGAEIGYNSFENYYGVFPGYTYGGRFTVGLGIGKTRDLVNKLNGEILASKDQGNEDISKLQKEKIGL